MNLHELALDGQYLPFDPHGMHVKNAPGDDGLSHPQGMVAAAIEKGVVPARTGHNTLGRYGDYLVAMQEAGLGKVAVPGIEWSYLVPIQSYSAFGENNTAQGEIYFGPGRDKFKKPTLNSQDHYQSFTLEEIRNTQTRIYDVVIDHLIAIDFEKNEERILEKLERAYDAYSRITYSHLTADQQATYRQIVGWTVAIQDPAFSAFYHYYLYSLEQNSSLGERINISGLNQLNEAEQIGLLGFTFLETGLDKPQNVKSKGELITLMLPDKQLIHKMQKLVDRWRESGDCKTKPFTDLFQYLTEGLTQSEFNSLLFYYPHPISIDLASFGKLIVRGMEGDVTLYSPEQLIPEYAQRIDAVEILNAAHPGYSNNAVKKMLGLDILTSKAHMGASDSHHPAWVGTAATLLRCDELTTEGIFDAIRKQNTLPISGLGQLSETWAPFFLWATTVPFKGRNFTPPIVFSTIFRMSNVKKAALRALEDGLFEQRHSIDGWVK